MSAAAIAQNHAAPTLEDDGQKLYTIKMQDG
jgi:hypothetical protein